MSQENAVTIYISAASDLRIERDVLARTIAELPVSVVWRVVQTPIASEPLNVEALHDADVHVLIIGSDIRAPVGLELRHVQRARRPSIAFLKHDVARTPAGQVFINETQLDWRRFDSAHDLRRQLQHIVARHLLRHATRYVLSPQDVDQLESLLADDDDGSEQNEEQGGAGNSAVILSRERFRPSDGIEID